MADFSQFSPGVRAHLERAAVARCGEAADHVEAAFEAATPEERQLLDDAATETLRWRAGGGG